MITNILSGCPDWLLCLVWKLDDAKNYLRSLMLSSWMFLTTTLICRRKSMPQYVGPKIVAINRYSKPTMKRTSYLDDLREQGLTVQDYLNRYAPLYRMEPELTLDTSKEMTQLMPLGATAVRDTGSEDERWNQLPWFPKPQPGQRTSGSATSFQEYASTPHTILVTPFPDVAEIIPGLLTTL
jgi:hypothetical protein